MFKDKVRISGNVCYIYIYEFPETIPCCHHRRAVKDMMGANRHWINYETEYCSEI